MCRSQRNRRRNSFECASHECKLLIFLSQWDVSHIMIMHGPVRLNVMVFKIQWKLHFWLATQNY